MILLIVGAVGVAFVLGLVWLMRAENRHDDRAAHGDPFPRQPDHPGFADIRRSVQSLTWDDITHHQYPLTSPPGRNGGPPDPFAASGSPGTWAGAPASPAAPPPGTPSRASGPGTAAAAGSLARPGTTPPPLLTSPARPAVLILGAIISDLGAHMEAAWQREVLAPFPPDEWRIDMGAES